MRFSEIRARDIINQSDGRRLGSAIDFEISLEDGRITAIVVPGGSRLATMFSRENEIVIPWSQIRKIGHDVILVDLPATVR